MTHPIFIRVILITAAYFGLTYFGGEIGWKLLYPIRIFVTFLHEFGHAIGALITGGSVEAVRIHANGGGMTTTLDGNLAVILIGGYIGSALFGNILFYIGAKQTRLVKPVMALLILALLVTAFVWFNSVFTTLVLVIFAAILFWIGFKTSYGRDILMLLGLASVIYIIQDTAAGPSSDLKAFEREMVFLPAKLWMYIWLAVALGLIALNLKLLFKVEKTKETKVKP